MTEPLHLAVALDGYGWNPQAWRVTPEAPPVLSGGYWAELASTAERGLLDFLTIDDSLMPQPGRRERIDPKRLAGRADAVLVAPGVHQHRVGWRRLHQGGCIRGQHADRVQQEPEGGQDLRGRLEDAGDQQQVAHPGDTSTPI